MANVENSEKVSERKKSSSSPPGKLYRVSSIISDDSIKRNDSCSSFGKMEFVSLDPAESDSQPTANVNTDSCDSQKESVERTEVIGDSTTNKDGNNSNISLRQYFMPDPQNSGSEEFFKTIASKANEFVPDDTKFSSDVNDEKKSSSSTKGESSDSETAVKKKESTGDLPSLSKFFVEDKSGHDATGKAFFDKIAVVSSENPPFNIHYQESVNKRNFCTSQTDIIPVTMDGSATPSVLESVSPDNEMYEAWIPSEATRQTLLSFVTSVPGTFYPHKDSLTKPCIIIEEEIEDPLKLLLNEVSSPAVHQRKVLTANDVLQNEDGLKELMEAGCYHAAINLTTRLLKSGYGLLEQAHVTPKLLQIWFTRIALFVKLGKFSFAEVESEAFGNFDKPDLYYEFYPHMYCGKKGTMVPFSFRLLLSELPQYQGNHQVALNNLYSLLNVIQKIIQNLENGLAEDGSMFQLTENRRKASIKLWRSREIKVFYSILNCVLSQKDYVMAVSIAHILMEKDKEHILQLYSALGRIYLQLGDMRHAQHFFNLVALQTENTTDKNLELEHLINTALLAVAHNDNEEAYKLYERGLSIQPNNPMLVNNMTVCLLYMGRLKESLTLLEKTIQANPKSCLHEGILFNICTLYELESSHCTVKKHAMLNLVSKYAGDNFNISCLKISPSLKS